MSDAPSLSPVFGSPVSLPTTTWRTQVCPQAPSRCACPTSATAFLVPFEPDSTPIALGGGSTDFWPHLSGEDMRERRLDVARRAVAAPHTSPRYGARWTLVLPSDGVQGTDGLGKTQDDCKDRSTLGLPRARMPATPLRRWATPAPCPPMPVPTAFLEKVESPVGSPASCRTPTDVPTSTWRSSVCPGAPGRWRPRAEMRFGIPDAGMDSPPAPHVQPSDAWCPGHSPCSSFGGDEAASSPMTLTTEADDFCLDSPPDQSPLRGETPEPRLGQAVAGHLVTPEPLCGPSRRSVHTATARALFKLQ